MVLHYTYPDDRGHLPPNEYNTLLAEGFSFCSLHFQFVKQTALATMFSVSLFSNDKAFFS